MAPAAGHERGGGIEAHSANTESETNLKGIAVTNSPTPNPESTPIHVSILLDRSGSMSLIADDIVGGLNEFIMSQQSRPGAVRLTLVQFDSEDPFEVVFDGVGLSKVPLLSLDRYLPRGATPLYDAVGRMIARTDAEIVARADHGLPIEDQVILIVTDGRENASCEYTRSAVFELIRQRRDRAWTFVFLGANQDAFEEGAAMAVPVGNSRGWEATGAGSRDMWRALSTSTLQHRSRNREERRQASDRFLDEDDG